MRVVPAVAALGAMSAVGIVSGIMPNTPIGRSRVVMIVMFVI